MNNNSTPNQNSSTKNVNEVSIWESLKEGLKAIDAHAWPAFIMFLLLVGTETTANIISSVQDFGLIVALFIGVLFGVFLAGWHIVSERPLNSIRQQSVSHAMTGLTTGGAILLLVVNLIRLSSNGNINLTTSLLPTTSSIGGWDVAAIVIIGIMFAVHLVGYQMWHNADDVRKMKREHNQEIGKVTQKQNSVALAIKSSEAELQSIEAELNSVNDLKVRFGHLPPELLNPILEEARNKVRAEFKKAPIQSNSQGNQNNNQRPQQNQNNNNNNQQSQQKPEQRLQQAGRLYADTNEQEKLPSESVQSQQPRKPAQLIEEEKKLNQQRRDSGRGDGNFQSR